MKKIITMVMCLTILLFGCVQEGQFVGNTTEDNLIVVGFSQVAQNRSGA